MISLSVDWKGKKTKTFVIFTNFYFFGVLGF